MRTAQGWCCAMHGSPVRACSEVAVAGTCGLHGGRGSGCHLPPHSAAAADRSRHHYGIVCNHARFSQAGPGWVFAYVCSTSQPAPIVYGIYKAGRIIPTYNASIMHELLVLTAATEQLQMRQPLAPIQPGSPQEHFHGASRTGTLTRTPPGLLPAGGAWGPPAPQMPPAGPA